MEEYIKNQYIKAYGDPHEEFDAVLKQSLLERELQYNEEAYTFSLTSPTRPERS